MALTIAERKHRMPHGAQRRIARAEGISEGFVSAVVNETFVPRTERTQRKARRVQVRVARVLGMTVDEAFPPPAPETEASPLERVG